MTDLRSGLWQQLCAQARRLSLSVAPAAAIVAASVSAAQAGTSADVPIVAQSVQTTRIVWNPTTRRSTVTTIMSNDPLVVRPVNRGPGCNPIVDSVANQFSNINIGSEITLQLGMVENEGFGSSYTVVDPVSGTPENEAFPVEVQTVEAMFATVASGIGPNIKLGYRIEVYDGDPNTGVQVFGIDSQNPRDANPDPALPAFISLQRVTNQACNPTTILLGGGAAPNASVGILQFSVDQSADPQDRMLVNGNAGNNRFSVVVKINQQNTQPASQCSTPDFCNDIFMCTEGTSVNGSPNPNSPTFSSRNFLVAVQCPPLLPGFPSCPGGVYAFNNNAISSCRPTRDVLQQVTYLPSLCPQPLSGACCNATTGACATTTQAACSGTFQGDSTVCSPNPCPQPTGACCNTGGSCTIATSSSCTSGGGTFQGAGSSCGSVNCPQPSGACCAGAGCALLAQSQCLSLGGSYIGNNVQCGPLVNGNPSCPLGACCLPAGSCTGGLSQIQCTGQGGTFQGVGSTCSGVSCPQPNGACCSTTGSCASVSQSICSLFGGTWAGPLTTCTSNPCVPPGVCCRGATCASGVAQASCVSPAAGIGAAFNSVSSTCNLSGNFIGPCCIADFDKAGGIAVPDIFAFLAAWFNGSPYAIPGGTGSSGTPQVGDIFTFLGAWFAGGC